MANITDDYGLAVMADAPAAYYRMQDTGLTMTDSSGNGLHGTWPEEPVIGPGLTNNNGDAPSLSAGWLPSSGSNAAFASGFAPSTPLQGDMWSVEMWFTLIDHVVNTRLFGARNNSSSANQIVASLESAGMSGIASWSGSYAYSRSYQFADGYVYHLVYSYDKAAKKAYVYVNGALTDVTSATLSIGPRFSVGNAYNGTGGNLGLNGAIGEVAVYDKLLPSERVAAHYDIGKGRIPNSLGTLRQEILTDRPYAYYDFGNPDNVLADSSGNGRHATFVGASTKAASITGYGKALYSLGSAITAQAPFSIYDAFGGTRRTGALEGWFSGGETAQAYLNASTTPTGGPVGIFRTSATGRKMTAFGSTYSWTSPDPARVEPHHYVISCDGSQTTIFIDGVAKQSGSIREESNFQEDPAQMLRILGAGTSSAVFPRGRYASDVAIYDHPLSATRVAAHYAARALQGPPTLEATRSAAGWGVQL